MSNVKLKIAYKLAGHCDHSKARTLLEQYGLHFAEIETRSDGPAIMVGEMPSVLSAMDGDAIEEHLAMRIEDSAPGTIVTRIEATIVVDDPKRAS